MTLTEFLLARIAEDEADAEKRGTWAVGHSERCIFEGGYEGTTSCDCGAVARLLAECEAKRQIVDWHEVVTNSFSPGTGCRICDDLGGDIRGDGPCLTVRWLALPYADHPDYREEWRP